MFNVQTQFREGLRSENVRVVMDTHVVCPRAGVGGEQTIVTPVKVESAILENFQ